MEPVKVLIVDDSLSARSAIKALISEDPDIHIVGEAVNGLEAIEKNLALTPDIITMDIEMPVMDGLESIERIMATKAVPILVVTARGDAQTAYTAISKGALEVLPKPLANDIAEFNRKLKLLSKVKVVTHLDGKRHLRKPLIPTSIRQLPETTDRVIAIAASTGGPKALSVLLSKFPEDFPAPILITQHIQEDFVIGMAKWLNEISKLNVKVGEEGELIKPGVVYFSPSNNHMTLKSSLTISLVKRNKTDLYSPSCNMLFSSIAGIYRGKTIAVQLTGMGDDGVAGLIEIKKNGGIVIAQNEKTSVVYGMPKAAVERGCVDVVLPLEEIPGYIIELLKSKK